MRRRISNFLIDLQARRAFDLIDRVAYWRRLAITARSNRAFRRTYPDFPVPPLAILWDAQATTDLAEYKRSGEQAAAQYWEIIRPHLDSARLSRVCEWGCGPARIVRHLPALAAGLPVEFHACDYNRASVAWCRAHLPNITFFDNGLAPPLPVGDRAFDVVFCRNLLIYFDDAGFDRAVGVLARVLAPGGYLLLGHSESLIDRSDAFAPVWLEGAMIYRKREAA